jgi:hypothetical protein
MMSTALAQAKAADYAAFYWAHDVHLWDGKAPFSAYAAKIAAAVR